MEQLEKFILSLVVWAMVLTFGYHTIYSFIHHNFDAAAINLIITLVILAIDRTLKEKKND